MRSILFDYILVGGGLQSGLLVLALRHHQPSARVLLVERDSQIGGNHTWSFHPEDVSPSAAVWLGPAVEYRWPSYRIRIHGCEKQIELSYASISSQYFADIVTRTMTCIGNAAHESTAAPGVLLLDTEVCNVSPTEITTACGMSYQSRIVIDCRGPKPAGESLFSQTGYQKFWGFELELHSDWPFEGPIVMDDSIDQSDGFRFLYSLPFERRRVLVEDTRFSNSTIIDRDECLEQVGSYLNSLGVKKWSILREEHGILSMPITGEQMPGSGIEAKQRTIDVEDSPVTALAGGYAGGWFHAATGYSFPLAIAFAETVASTNPECATAAVKRLATSHRVRSRFGRFLNRLLFCLVKPTKRYQIFKRFYKVLSAVSIARFYSHRFTMGDAFRIVVGMPPAGLQPGVFARSLLLHPKRIQASKTKSKQVSEPMYEEIGV